MSDVVEPDTRQHVAPTPGTRTNLFGLDRDAMSSFFKAHGESAFRAKQVMQWIYARGVTEFEQMTDLSKKLRERLPQIATIQPPTRIRE